MIINGGSRCNGTWFAKHLTNTRENDRAEVVDMRGLAAEQLPDAFREMEAIASGTKCKNYFYHANINPLDHEHLTPAEWALAVDRLEKNLGLEGQARFVVEHEKKGRIHRHVIWSRIDLEHMRAIRMDDDYAKHQATSRQLEKAFDLEHGRSVLGHDLDGPRPERRAKQWEMFRGQQSGIDPRDIKAELTALWRSADSGYAFAAALEAQGYILAKGDRRDFCVIDPAGDEHSLARRIQGVKAAEVRERMADIDRAALPSVAEARTQQKERQNADLLPQQKTDRNRLEVKQWQELTRLAEQLTHKEAMRDRFQQEKQEDHAARNQRRTARLGATLYDRADMVSMQRDAMRQLRDRMKAQERNDRQAHAHQRREAGQQHSQQTAYARTEARHAKQNEQLAVRQFLDRQRAGVADPERDRQALKILVPKQFDKAADQATLNATQKEQLRLFREQQEQERAERELQRQQEEARIRQAQQQHIQQAKAEGHTSETSTERTERLTREASGTGKVVTERDKRRQILDAARQQLGIPNPGEGQGRVRDR